MKQEIVEELNRRCDILIKHAKPNNIEFGMTGSEIIFRTSLCPIGYPYKPLDWMDEQYITPIMSDEEYFSDIYDNLFTELYNRVWFAVYGVNRNEL